jgi:methyltransferase-like protein
MTTWGFSAETERTLHHLATDVIQMEQYMDFVRNRTFRQTLLCHQDLPLSRNITSNHLLPMYVSSSAKPAVKDLDVRSAEAAEFTGPHGLKLTTSDVIAKAAMLALSQAWPRALSMSELHDLVWANFESASIRDAATISAECRELASRLLKCFVSDLVEINLHPPRFATQVPERPAATALQRRQARRSNLVTTLRHQTVRLNDVERHVLQNLDGTCDREMLLTRMAALVAEGVLVVQNGGKRVEDAEAVRALLVATLESSLQDLARHAVLSQG